MGLSMGGYKTWYLAHPGPDRFAAIGPVCVALLYFRMRLRTATSAAENPGR